jgi:cytidylate kinase
VADFIVAIDGPAGSGKSSVSKEVARRLGFGYLDTGAGYRAFALWKSLNPDSGSFPYEIATDPDAVSVHLDGQDVSDEIRTERVASLVSSYAQLPEIRSLQRTDARARIQSCPEPGIVVEGRDITTVVAPDAQVRVLLTASEQVRLRRRGLEGTESAENLVSRDQKDSKVARFMDAAEGVTVIDTSDLDFEQSVQAVLAEIARIRN